MTTEYRKVNNNEIAVTKGFYEGYESLIVYDATLQDDTMLVSEYGETFEYAELRNKYPINEFYQESPENIYARIRSMDGHKTSEMLYSMPFESRDFEESQDSKYKVYSYNKTLNMCMYINRGDYLSSVIEWCNDEIELIDSIFDNFIIIKGEEIVRVITIDSLIKEAEYKLSVMKEKVKRED